MAEITGARVPIPRTARDPMVPFGLELIDLETGGLIRDKLYLLYGPPPTWKSSLALYFLYEGLKNGGRALLITSQDPEAVIVQAERLGFNLKPFLQDERLVLLNYQARISQQVALLSDYQRVVAELRRLAGPAPLDRIVFDPLEVLIGQDNRANVLPSTRLLIEAVKGLNTTTLCLLEETAEPHIQVILKELLFLSFGALHISLEPDDSRVLHFRKISWNPREYPRIPLSLRSRQGIQVLEPTGEPREEPRLALASPRAGEAPTALEMPRAIHVLLVDNDDIYAEMLQDFLTARYQVEQVRDSVEAISRLLNRSYDVILVNLNMPRVDGREVVLRIRQHQNAIPLVVFSNRLKRGVDVAGVLRIGADMFVPRPLAFNQVKATLEAVLRRPSGPDAYARARALIQRILEAQEALRRLQPLDPDTGFNTGEYFETRLRHELEKATIGDYSFSLVGYDLRGQDGEDLEPVVRKVFRPLLRADDLVIRYAPGYYLVFLEECLSPGVRRLNERLRKAIQNETGGSSFTFRYQIATFPGDARSYDALMARVLEPLRNATSPQLKRLP